MILVRETHGNDLSALTPEEDRTFVFLFAVEIVLFTLAGFFAWLMVKLDGITKFHSTVERACLAYENRQSGLERFPDLIGVLYHNDDMYRIVAYREGNYRYMYQHFEIKGGWIDYYAEPPGFDTLEELESNIEDEFSDVILTKD